MSINSIFKSLQTLLQPASHKEPLLDERDIKKKYHYWRVRIFYSIYLGYAFFYFTRKSFTFIMPKLAEDLHLSNADLGFLGSILYLTYGVSKFASGVISDRSNPRYFMAIGLMLTGVFNILFGISSSLWWFAIFWGLNGWFQGWGWLPCAKQLTRWYAKSERGRWWSICSTSHNLGGALIPILATYCAAQYGWRYAMYVPGILCVVLGIILLNRLRDTPQSLGLPPIEKYKKEALEEEAMEQMPLTAKELLFQHVLNNKHVWILSLVYFFVYIIRTAVNDWSVSYLVEMKGYSLREAGESIFWFEIGGLLGILAAGWGSDYFFKGKRVPFIILCTIGIVLCIPGFWYLPAGNILLDYFFIGVIGFLIFGPQMLVGLAATEFVAKKAACTSNGFVGCFAYLGAAVAGWPLGKIIDGWHWYGYFIALFICSMLILLVLLVLHSMQGEEEKPHYGWTEEESNLEEAKV